VASEVSSSSTTTPAPGLDKPTAQTFFKFDRSFAQLIFAGTMPPPAAGYTYRPQVQPSGLPRPVATPVGGTSASSTFDDINNKKLGRVLPGSVQKPDPRQVQAFLLSSLGAEFANLVLVGANRWRYDRQGCCTHLLDTRSGGQICCRGLQVRDCQKESFGGSLGWSFS